MEHSEGLLISDVSAVEEIDAAVGGISDYKRCHCVDAQPAVDTKHRANYEEDDRPRSVA